MRRVRKSVSPKQGEALLDGLFRKLKLDGTAREYRALEAWREAAGPRIAARVRAERMWGTTMMLRVASAGWANELGFLKSDLLARLHEAGATWVVDLRFQVGPLDQAPSWEGDRVTQPPPPQAEPPKVDDGAVAAELRRIADPELRAAMAELYAHARHKR
ncbi:MAG: DUF721 domain-containing protein [Myxococcales bacterium]|nr:DUF721 domain-containing protein [Myxococcales bacterium]